MANNPLLADAARLAAMADTTMPVLVGPLYDWEARGSICVCAVVSIDGEFRRISISLALMTDAGEGPLRREILIEALGRHFQNVRPVSTYDLPTLGTDDAPGAMLAAFYAAEGDPELVPPTTH